MPTQRISKKKGWVLGAGRTARNTVIGMATSKAANFAFKKASSMWNGGANTTNRYSQVRNVKIKKRKRLSKRQRTFYKKVKNVVDADSASLMLIRNPYITAPLNQGNLLNQQGVTGFTLGALGGTAFIDNDVATLFGQSFGATVDEESFLELKSGILKYSMINRDANTLDIDIYDMICIKDVPKSLIATFPAIMFGNFVAEIQPTGMSSATQVTAQTPGVTPYAVAGTFGKYWKIKSHRKVYLPPGDAIDGQYSMKWNRRINGQDPIQLHSKAGVTRFFLVIVNTINWVASSGGLDMYMTKQYVYQANDQKTHAVGII